MGAMSNLFKLANGVNSLTRRNGEMNKPTSLKAFAKVAARRIFGDLVSCNLVGCIEDQKTLKRIAAGRVEGSSAIERGVAIERIGMKGDTESQRFLENLATTDSNPVIREFATGEVKNQNILAWITKNEAYPNVLEAAIKNVERPHVLKEAMCHNYRNPSVFEAVRQRLVDLSVPSMMGKSPKRVAFGA